MVPVSVLMVWLTMSNEIINHHCSTECDWAQLCLILSCVMTSEKANRQLLFISFCVLTSEKANRQLLFIWF